MVFILPLMFGGGGKLRVWAALIGSAFAAMAFPPVAVTAYIAIDTVAASVIMHRRISCAQKIIGAIYVLMICFHVGFLLSSGGNAMLYTDVNRFLGWLQLCCLAIWGAYDTGKAVFGSWGVAIRKVAIGAGV